MSDHPPCPKCGNPLPVDAPASLCPKCLVQAGWESQPGSQAKLPLTAPSASSPGFEPPAAAELAGKLPQLEILELLGKGGMGAVYKARQRGLDRLVAVKVLPPEIGSDPAFAERFAREAKALARLSHNHIVSVFDFGQADGLFFIVMEYVDGVNLRQTIQAGKLTPQEALAIVPQICEALQFAHDEGIVHRDIKPENILIDKRGRVKIADFGLAKLMASGGRESPDASLTATHQVMGTLRYMAPEQMLGTREVDHRADIYSLGVIFYELLTGELPMGKFAPPSKKVQIDVRLDEIVLRALEQHPEQRYQHASELKTDVESIPKVGYPALQTLPQAATDGLAFLRLSVFNVLFWLVWSALLAALHGGYVTGANWYFKQELPYRYLSGAWFWISLMFAYFFVYWWYLLAKSPQTARSLADAWRTVQTPDLRAKRLWLPGGIYLGLWMVVVPLMSLAGDAAQSTTLIALVIAAPLVAAGACWWAYRERAGELLRDQGPPADRVQRISHEPRFSVFAILGAVWALFGVLAIIPTLFFIGLNRVWNGTALPTDIIYEAPPLAFTIFMGALLAIGAGAPIGTTIYGAIAINHIKRSGGKIIGLPLAVADAIFFPLLALGSLIAFLTAQIWAGLAPHSNAASPYSAISFGTLVGLVVCFFVARAAWRAIAGGMAYPESSAASKENQPGMVKATSEHRLSRLALFGALWAPMPLLGYPAWHLAIRKYFDNPEALKEIHPAQVVVAAIILALGATAFFGTTILGFVAIEKIKRSGGKLYGLRLAQADALFFPLLILAAAAGLAGTFVILVMIPLGIDGYVLSKEDPPYLAILAVAATLWFFPARALWRAVVGPPGAFAIPRIPLVGTESLVGQAALVIALAAIAAHAWPWEWIIMPNNHSVVISNFEDIRAMQSLFALTLAIAAALFAAAPSLTLPVKRIIRGAAVLGALAALVLQIQFYLSLGEFEPGTTVVRLTRSYPQMGLYAVIVLTAFVILFFMMRFFEERVEGQPRQ